ncbi:porin family protein [Labilibacter marinus]|uniref:porin family protein n=1 Tax=Labilibacter marinus TaxID=1477105 RepID=UPI00094FB176|nr:porin family protein [Labilibacter marinus]
MKKLLFVLAFVGVTFASSAQDRVAIGLKTGFNSTKINLSSIPSGSDIKNEAKGGFLFGGFAKIRLTEKFYVQPELYYAKKNTEITEEGISTDGNLQTWDIPLLARLDVLDLKVAKIYGIGGPVASFITKSDFDNLENTNWTVQAGGGVEFWRLTADVRYEWGVKNIAKVDIDGRTDVLTFTLGFKLIGL